MRAASSRTGWLGLRVQYLPVRSGSRKSCEPLKAIRGKLIVGRDVPRPPKVYRSVLEIVALDDRFVL
jgi:hypothetical protein